MHCPFCRNPDSRVVDSRETDEGQAIRRRRSCPECGRRFTTVETAVLAVVKRSGVTEPFSREKVISGVRRACQGRQVDDDALNLLAQQVEDTRAGRRLTGGAQQRGRFGHPRAATRTRRGRLSPVRLGLPVVHLGRRLRARDPGVARTPRDPRNGLTDLRRSSSCPSLTTRPATRTQPSGLHCVSIRDPRPWVMIEVAAEVVGHPNRRGPGRLVLAMPRVGANIRARSSPAGSSVHAHR